VRLGGVEADRLHDTLGLGEGSGGAGLGDTVDEDLTGGLDIGGQGGEVVSLGVPHHLGHDVLELHLHHSGTHTRVILEAPFAVLLFIFTCFLIDLIQSL
jgi:hypothetical protein